MSEREILLSMNAIEKKFGDVQVLKKVDMEVARGEVHALMGENGAGKSTLIKAILNIIPSTGIAKIDDKISKEFYYLDRMYATGEVKEFIMPNTDKSAVEIEWALDTPVREDIYEYIING